MLTGLGDVKLWNQTSCTPYRNWPYVAFCAWLTGHIHIIQLCFKLIVFPVNTLLCSILVFSIPAHVISFCSVFFFSLFLFFPVVSFKKNADSIGWLKERPHWSKKSSLKELPQKIQTQNMPNYVIDNIKDTDKRRDLLLAKKPPIVPWGIERFLQGIQSHYID